MPSALEVQSLNHWTTREVPWMLFYLLAQIISNEKTAVILTFVPLHIIYKPFSGFFCDFINGFQQMIMMCLIWMVFFAFWFCSCFAWDLLVLDL